jgi:glutamate/aspartate transport system permease protein
MGYQWNWGVFLQPRARAGTTPIWAGCCRLQNDHRAVPDAWVIALLLGALVGVLRTVPNKTLAGIATAYVELFRNVPLLVQLFIWYFVLPELLPAYRRCATSRISTQCSSSSSPRWSASACSPAPASPSRSRSASTRLPRGQKNAGLALGFTLPQTYRL